MQQCVSCLILFSYSELFSDASSGTVTKSLINSVVVTVCKFYSVGVNTPLAKSLFTQLSLDRTFINNKMSLLAKMFGSGGKDKKMLSTGEAIQKLRDTEEMLIKKQEFFEKKIEEELAIAKKNGTKNKRGMNSL